MVSASSSAVIRASVRIRQSRTSSSPWYRPSAMLVLPTSMASSTGSALRRQQRGEHGGVLGRGGCRAAHQVRVPGRVGGVGAGLDDAVVLVDEHDAWLVSGRLGGVHLPVGDEDDDVAVVDEGRGG